VPDLADIINKILDFLEPFYARYGYFIVFAGAMLEHTFLVSWALPGGIMIALGGMYAQGGDLNLLGVILCGILGFMVGDHIDYIVGRRGSRVLERLTKGRSANAPNIWSLKAIPAMIPAYIHTLTRSTMFMGGAASGKLPYHRFLVVSFGLATFWSITNSVIGYWVGTSRDEVLRVLNYIGLGGQIFVLVFITAVLLLVLRRRSRSSSKLPNSLDLE